MDQLDFKTVDPRFQNVPEVKGSPLSEMDQKRAEFIQNELPSLNLTPIAPGVVEGLTKITSAKGLPSTRSFWRPMGSYERNGFLNMLTHSGMTKVRMVSFYFFVIWGLTNHVTNGVYVEEKYQNFDMQNHHYDKIAYRKVPSARVWSRPA